MTADEPVQAAGLQVPEPERPLGMTGRGQPAAVRRVGERFDRAARVARFSEAGAQPGSFHVLIDWGDQSTPTPGQVRRMGKNRFTVVGTHRFLTTGVFQVMAMIHDQSGQEADAMSMVTVTGKVRPAH